MKKKYILFCFVLFSCQNEKSTFTGIVVNKHDVEKIEAIPLENENALFDYRTVRLETNSNSLLGEISQMEIADNYIYVFDKIGKSVKKFTDDGKYVTDIGKRGNGHEEYIAINAFYVNKEKKYVGLFDPMKKAILRYDLEGNFMDIIKTNNNNLDFIIKASAIGNDEVFCHSTSNWHENYAFFILNEKDYSIKKIIRHHPAKPEQWTSFSLSKNTFSNCGDRVDFVSLFSDFIYTYRKGDVSEFMLITDNKQSLSSEMIDKKVKEEYNNDMTKLMADICKSSNYTAGLSEIYETDKYILCNYYVNDSYLTVHSILWDKERKQGYRSSPGSAPNFCDASYSFDDTFVRVWDGDEIETFKEGIEKGIYQASQFPQSIMNTIRDYNVEEDNPILIFYTAKK